MQTVRSLRGLTLRPGDPRRSSTPLPANGTGRPSTPTRIQVGHYHLLRREYAEAWHWYEQAAPAPPDAEDHSPQQFVQRFVRGRDALFFHAYCLSKLGHEKDAATIRRHFAETFLPELPPAPKAPPRPTPGLRCGGPPADQATIAALARSLHRRGVPQPRCGRGWRTLLPRRPQGRRVRRGSPEPVAASDAVPPAAGQTEEYAELATETVLPLLLRTWKPRPANRLPFSRSTSCWRTPMV